MYLCDGCRYQTAGWYLYPFEGTVFSCEDDDFLIFLVTEIGIKMQDLKTDTVKREFTWSFFEAEVDNMGQTNPKREQASRHPSRGWNTRVTRAQKTICEKGLVYIYKKWRMTERETSAKVGVGIRWQELVVTYYWTVWKMTGSAVKEVRNGRNGKWTAEMLRWSSRQRLKAHSCM